jgi:hypothetical protein
MDVQHNDRIFRWTLAAYFAPIFIPFKNTHPKLFRRSLRSRNLNRNRQFGKWAVAGNTCHWSGPKIVSDFEFSERSIKGNMTAADPIGS